MKIKIKIFILIIVIGIFAVVGVPNIKNAIKEVNQYNLIDDEIKLLFNQINENNQQKTSLKNQLLQKQGNTIDVTNAVKIGEAISNINSVTIQEIKIYKMNSQKEGVLIATLNNINDILNISTEISMLQFSLVTNDTIKTVNSLYKLNLYYDVMTINNISNEIIVRILVL